MPDLSLRPILLSVVLVLATTLGVAAKASRPNTARPPKPAAPTMSFDGRGSVVIVTDAGSSDRACRYGVRILGGRIYDDGDSAAVINGQVDTHSNVSVNVRQSTASGAGHLTESDGGGRWQGASTSSSCSGRWEAERR